MRITKSLIKTARIRFIGDRGIDKNLGFKRYLSDDALEQKQMREKILAEAVAKEEEAKAREKAIRETRGRVKAAISAVNKAPWADAVANSLVFDEKHAGSAMRQQLDHEIEDLLLRKTILPSFKISNRPWIKSSNQSQLKNGEISVPLSQQIKSTTNTHASRFPNLTPTPDYKSYSDSELFLRQMAHTQMCGKLGSHLKNIFEARSVRDTPPSISEISINHLMSAGCHLGHSKSLWRPSTQPYIYGEYQGMHLIDLNETIASLKRCSHVLKDISRKGGLILFVGTGKHAEQHRALEKAAERCNGYYVSRRWIPGTITNALEVTKQLGGVQKVEVNLGDEITSRAIPQDRTLKPDIVVILNPVENRNVIYECTISRIPTIGLSDTDMEPSLLSYPIPCNDDSIRATSLILGVLSRAAEEGMRERNELFQAFSSKKASA